MIKLICIVEEDTWGKKEKNRRKITMYYLKYFVKVLSFICYVGLIVYLAVSLPILFKSKPLVVLSGSMEPTYKVGSIIYYKESKDFKKGDVIVFQTSNDTNVTHRIEEIENGKITTKGDANETVDAQKITAEAVKGKVQKYSIPFVGYYINFINKNMWITSIAVLVLVSDFLVSNLKMFDINRKERRNSL
jgi:signal peptidase